MKTELTDFKEKVQAMSAKEIIMAMVEGLQNPVIKIEMRTFGDVIDGVCYGCAATNMICKISGKVFDETNIVYRVDRINFLSVNYQFLEAFEEAIDGLRRGYIDGYNQIAEKIGIAQIKYHDEIYLPVLHNIYTYSELDAYINLANSQ